MAAKKGVSHIVAILHTLGFRSCKLCPRCLSNIYCVTIKEGFFLSPPLPETPPLQSLVYYRTIVTSLCNTHTSIG